MTDDAQSATCIGSWLLGTACGNCLRCAETRPDQPTQTDALKIAREALQEARGSLYQCFRSSRNDALESHPDWAEHIADIHFEAATALAKIDAALKETT